MTALPGVGTQYPQPDPRGWLVFGRLPNGLQNAEDATALADYQARTGRDTRWYPIVDPTDDDQVFRYFTRPATDTERALLGHLGYTLPDELDTYVRFITGTLRQRRWLTLES